MQNKRTLLFNITFGCNCLLLFLLLFYTQLQVPGWLQVVGRMHPLLLHFPIVLLIICIVWELFVQTKHNTNALIISIGDGLLLAAALAAVLTALMGLFLSREEGYEQSVLSWHMYAGVFISVLMLAWYGFRQRIRRQKGALAATAFAGLVLILITGHQGANITHGEDFLLSPMKSEEIKEPVTFEAAMVYGDVIHPILQAKCMSCHNNSKAKGELNMTTQTLLLKGGKSGRLWDTTGGGPGLLLERIHLPDEHKKHMPPRSKPALTEEEKEMLYQWIKSGASFTAKLSALPPGDSLRLLAKANFTPATGDAYSFAAADEQTLKTLNNAYRLVQPVALGSPALSVTFFSASQYKPSHLQELLQVKEQLVVLNLNKMPVEDEALKTIAQFGRLQRLNLSFTNITGAGLSQLASLKELRHLSLSGTGVSASQVKALAGMPQLKEISVWNTAIKQGELVMLQQQMKQVHLQSGFRADTIVLKLTPPVIENEETIITGASPLQVKHYVKNTLLRYTTDGTVPDSVKSPLYNNKVVVDKDCVVKVKAFKPGWAGSDVAEKRFYKTAYLPDSVTLVTGPDAKYRGDGATTLYDGVKGDLYNKGSKWIAYRDGTLEAILHFGKPRSISQLSVSSLVDVPQQVMPPQSIELWAGEDTASLRFIKKIIPGQPGRDAAAALAMYKMPVPPMPHKVYKLVIKPVPAMAAGKDKKREKAWVFVDEILFN